MDEELYHHGILGQKWGVRRFQNADGSLTKAGKKHINKMNTYKDKLIKKTLKDASNADELSKQSSYSQQYRSAFLKSSAAQRYAADALKDMKISTSTTKKDLKKAIDYIAEKQFNNYVVAYHNDGSVELVNPSSYTRKN